LSLSIHNVAGKGTSWGVLCIKETRGLGNCPLIPKSQV